MCILLKNWSDLSMVNTFYLRQLLDQLPTPKSFDGFSDMLSSFKTKSVKEKTMKRQQDRTEECNPNEPNDKINKSTSKLSPIKSKVKQTKETEISRRNTGRRKLLHNLNYIIYHLGDTPGKMVIVV
ncbi:hypothetical protein RIR_jg32338.t2 [Rhizophagus irregularis DAOM 181602=DAOM 197198]|nr:hypothetical protein RIR_jg32338.t2 [Rhizophagus irregularis DAOM 181602=DAOM 197198]